MIGRKSQVGQLPCQVGQFRAQKGAAGTAGVGWGGSGWGDRGDGSGRGGLGVFAGTGHRVASGKNFIEFKIKIL